MEVKSSVQEKESSKKEAGFEASVGWGPFKASMHGSVSSHTEQTRKSDNSAKYHVKVSAKQAATPEGLNRILDLLRDTITPTKITASPSSPDDPV